MNARTQITMDQALQRRARQRATDLGISFAEYVRRVVASDLGGQRQRSDVSAVFDLVVDGPASEISRDKDRMVAEAVWREHQRKTVGLAAARPVRIKRRAKNHS
jgi:hypothetical protein